MAALIQERKERQKDRAQETDGGRKKEAEREFLMKNREKAERKRRRAWNSGGLFLQQHTSTEGPLV